MNKTIRTICKMEDQNLQLHRYQNLLNCSYQENMILIRNTNNPSETMHQAPFSCCHVGYRHPICNCFIQDPATLPPIKVSG